MYENRLKTSDQNNNTNFDFTALKGLKITSSDKK